MHLILDAKMQDRSRVFVIVTAPSLTKAPFGADMTGLDADEVSAPMTVIVSLVDAE